MNTIYEILEKANNYKQSVRRIKYLKDNNNKVLRSILHANFSESISLKMPAGSPPYEPNEEVEHDEALYANMGRFMPSAQHQWAREKLFVDFLQSIPAKDAELVIAMKDKKITELFPKITKEVFQEVWPNLK